MSKTVDELKADIQTFKGLNGVGKITPATIGALLVALLECLNDEFSDYLDETEIDNIYARKDEYVSEDELEGKDLVNNTYLSNNYLKRTDAADLYESKHKYYWKVVTINDDTTPDNAFVAEETGNLQIDSIVGIGKSLYNNFGDGSFYVEKFYHNSGETNYLGEGSINIDNDEDLGTVNAEDDFNVSAGDLVVICQSDANDKFLVKYHYD